MIRVFKHYVPNAVALLGLIDFVILLAAAECGWLLRAAQLAMIPEAITTRLPQLAAFAVPLAVAMVAVGAYQADVLVSLRQAVMRLIVAVSLGVIFLSLLYFFLPTVSLWRSSLFYAMLFAIAGLVAARVLFRRMLGGDRFRRRIVVLGAGAAARLSLNPFEAMTTVTAKIVSQLTGDADFASPEALVAFALGMTLFVITLGLNVIALYIVRKYREQYE